MSRIVSLIDFFVSFHIFSPFLSAYTLILIFVHVFVSTGPMNGAKKKSLKFSFLPDLY